MRSRQQALFATFLLCCSFGVAIADTVHSEWRTSTYGDPFQDEALVLAMTSNSKNETLAIKCDEFGGSAYVAIVLSEIIDELKQKTARVRFDKGEIFQIQGRVDGEIFLVSGSGNLEKLFRGFRQSNSIAFELFNYEGNRVVFQFGLGGYSLAERQVRTTCTFAEWKKRTFVVIPLDEHESEPFRERIR